MLKDTEIIKGFFFLNPDSLCRFAETHHASYTVATPYPHIVMDNFFPKEILEKILLDFPRPSEMEIKRDNSNSKKYGSYCETQWGPATRLFIYQLNSSPFIEFLETLTGVKGLIPDPHFWGGGLHQIERGGFLKIHADFNRYKKLAADRRLNLLLYLNQDWKEEWGGHLELWNRKMTKCEKKIPPTFNRCVIFNTNKTSFHGHPDPLNCPPDQSRKSIALYYYTNGRPFWEFAFSHSTLYQKRPSEKK